MFYIAEHSWFGVIPEVKRLAYYEWAVLTTPNETIYSAETLFSNTTKVSLPTPTKQVNGYITYELFDDVYNRIHFRPAQINVGNLMANRIYKVNVWNAYFESRTLNNITQINTEGIVSDATAPATFSLLEEKEYTIIVTTDGAPVIDATYIFHFDVYPAILSIVGQRTAVFKWIPLKEFTETLEWKTDVINTWNGEQRIALRKAPRQLFNFNFIKTPKTAAEMQTVFRNWVYRNWVIPIWQEQRRIQQAIQGATSINFPTSNTSYVVGGYAVIWESDDKAEAMQVMNIRPDGIDISQGLSQQYTNALIMPARLGLAPNGLIIRRLGSNATEFTTTLLIVNEIDYSATSYPTYDGYDILIDGNVMIGSLEESIAQTMQFIDNGQGLITVEPTRNYVDNRKTVGKVAVGQANIWKWKQWLYSKKGMQKAFWLPSFANDIQPVSTIFANNTYADIRNIDLNTHGIFPIATQLVLKNGATYYRKITGATLGTGYETISFDSAFGIEIAPENIHRWSIMSLVRFDTDSIELGYNGVERLTCNIPVKEVKV